MLDSSVIRIPFAAAPLQVIYQNRAAQMLYFSIENAITDVISLGQGVRLPSLLL